MEIGAAEAVGIQSETRSTRILSKQSLIESRSQQNLPFYYLTVKTKEHPDEGYDLLLYPMHWIGFR